MPSTQLVRAGSPSNVVNFPRLYVVTKWRDCVIFIVEKFVVVSINTAELHLTFVTIKFDSFTQQVRRMDFMIIEYL